MYVLPYLHSQGGVSCCISPFVIDLLNILIYRYIITNTQLQLPRFQHYSYDSQYKEWGINKPHQSQLLRNCKNKKDLLRKKVFAIYAWSRFTDSNRRPTVYKTVALTS